MIFLFMCRTSAFRGCGKSGREPALMQSPASRGRTAGAQQGPRHFNPKRGESAKRSRFQCTAHRKGPPS